MGPEIVARLEERAGIYWNEFYRVNANRFYKDRHWFMQEFGEHLLAPATTKLDDMTELSEGRVRQKTFLEVGCGTGSTIYPLLDVTGPWSHVYACDFAPEAVELVRRHPGFSSGRVTVFEADITRPDVFAGRVPRSHVDVCMMVFVLSAISPLKMRFALENIGGVLAEGGKVCFRDYARDDLCEKRMVGEGRQRVLQPFFYVRGDSTRCYYFTVEVLDCLFAQAGFEPVQGTRIVIKHEMNRKTGEARERRYIQGVYRKAASRLECADPFAGDAASIMEGVVDGMQTNMANETNDTIDMNGMSDNVEEHDIGCLTVWLPSARLVDRLLAAYLCSSDIRISSKTYRITHTVEVATEVSSGALSFALLQAADTRRHICCAQLPTARARMRRTLMSNASRFLWERARVGHPDDVERVQCIAFEWHAEVAGGDMAIDTAAGLARRTGAHVITACSEEEFEALLAQGKKHGLVMLKKRPLTAVAEGPPCAALVNRESTLRLVFFTAESPASLKDATFL